MTQLIIQHTDVLKSGKTLQIYGERPAEPGIIRGRCFCDSPITISYMYRSRALMITIAHGDLEIACADLILLRNWVEIGIDPGLSLVLQACKSHDEWAGLL